MKYRAGFVGLLGCPNAGKSTLLNLLVGEKVAIVNSKPQTTRSRVQGVLSTDSFQAIFVDTPGVIRAQKGLNRYLQQEYQEALKDVDALLVLLNIDESSQDKIKSVIRMARESGKPWVGVITKEDLPQVHRILILRGVLNEEGVPVAQISALKKPEEARERLLEVIEPMLPDSPAPLYDDELFTLQSQREIVAEFIRESCFENLHKEIPFGLAVKILKFEEPDKGAIKIQAQIVVSKDNHRSIVVGSGGSMLKTIGMQSRQKIESLVGRKVFLQLHVTVRKNWTFNDNMMKELGYALGHQ